MGNGLPSLPFFTSDFLVAVAAWPTERVGAYCLALFYQWEHGSLPVDDAAAMALVFHTQPAKARKLWAEIAGKFQVQDGQARNLRLEEHRQEIEARVAQAKDHGRKGARAKWHKHRLSTARALPEQMPEQSPSNSNQNQSHNHKEKPIARDKPAPDPRVSNLFSLFNALHVERFGTKAAINGAKDGSIFKGLLAEREESEIQALMRAFFYSRDKFIAEAGFTVGVFKSQIGKLLAQTAASKPAPVVPLADFIADLGHYSVECNRIHGGLCKTGREHYERAEAERAQKVSA
jgi:uncharacterized protein YdaU (DUF1376 family)